MSSSIKWQFPPNLTNAPIGPRDRGIEHYTGHRLDSLVRETIQNSLDAQAKPGLLPAKVDFRLRELQVSSFNGSELAAALNSSISGLKPKDEAYRKMFRKAVAQLDKDTIPTLVITDSNTTGVRDDGDDDCPWAALTRGSGESAKQANNASGSYGIGKAAAYLATDLRTALYSTTFYVRDQNSEKENRFIGKAILSGHKDQDGNKVTSEGYLSAEDFASLCNGDIPAPYRLDEPGLCLQIPGYRASRNWEDDVVRVAVENFFHALIKGELEVTVGEKVVNASTIEDFSNLLSIRDKYLLETSRKEAASETTIPDVGTVKLRITLHDAIEENIRDVALVRDAGMMITKNRTKMGPARFTIPGHWNRFTAIVECLSDPEGESAVRNCESPKHDELDIDRIPNAEDHATARQALQALGRWMREEIRKYVEPSNSTDPVNATEAAALLPIKQSNNNPNEKPQPDGDSISQPVQRGTISPMQRVTPSPPPSPPDPNHRRQPPRPPAPPEPQVMTQLDALSRAKFRHGGRHITHGLTVQIPPIAKRINNVQVQAVTEQGQDVALKISRAWINGKELKTDRGKISAITPNGDKPVTMEINLQEPVDGRRFRLRTSQLKGTSQ